MDTKSRFSFSTPAEMDAPGRRYPVAVIGSGPVGLTCALDLASRGIPVVLLDDDDGVAEGSRAICWAKRTLEIWDRIGVCEALAEKGVTWSVGRVFHANRELYAFDLLPEHGHRRPAFVNLQQYYVESFLIERVADYPQLIELRWKSEVVGLTQLDEGVRLDVATPEGRYVLEASWVVVADGARSPTRARMGLTLEGQRFEERFLIADVRMDANFPTERLFWFEPTFHRGQSALLHRQPDDVFRIDFQLGPDADPELERRPEKVLPRVRAIVGDEVPIELEWCSVYSFRCARLERFVHGRVVFAGDSAHVVSPFGARGGNGGVQDADNLCWKLALVLKGEAPESLIATYDEERGHGADENIVNSSRTTMFMTPKSPVEHRFRNGVLALSAIAPFARAMLNAGRLSKPCSLNGLSLQTPDASDWAGGVAPGEVCLDAPLETASGEATWLLDNLGGPFNLLVFAGGDVAADLAELETAVGLPTIVITTRPVANVAVFFDKEGFASRRYDGQPGTTYLIRPDAHVAARFKSFDAQAVAAALARAQGRRGLALLKVV